MYVVNDGVMPEFHISSKDGLNDIVKVTVRDVLTSEVFLAFSKI